MPVIISVNDITWRIVKWRLYVIPILIDVRILMTMMMVIAMMTWHSGDDYDDDANDDSDNNNNHNNITDYNNAGSSLKKDHPKFNFPVLPHSVFLFSPRPLSTTKIKRGRFTIRSIEIIQIPGLYRELFRSGSGRQSSLRRFGKHINTKCFFWNGNWQFGKPFGGKWGRAVDSRNDQDFVFYRCRLGFWRVIRDAKGEIAEGIEI